jgi:hypothetical protein
MESYGRDETRPGIADTERSGPEAGILRFSLFSRIVIAVALGVALVGVAVHLGMSFLHVAPPNTVSKKHREAIDDYVFPEFEQNWKLFAPNPLQQNISVEVRAAVRDPGVGSRTTGWIDLTAEDAAAIRHNPAPSHTEQNELRRSWDYYINSHDEKNRATGERGELAEAYLRRIVMLRLGPELDGARIERVQVRSAANPVEPPSWSDETIDTRTMHRKLPWWTIREGDLQRGDLKRWEAGAE